MRARLLSGYWVSQAPTCYAFLKEGHPNHEALLDLGCEKVMQLGEDAPVIRSALTAFANGELPAPADLQRWLR